MRAQSKIITSGYLSRWLALCSVLFLGLVDCHAAGERINHEGRVLGPALTISAPTLFNTPQADAVVSSMQIMPVDNPWNEDVSRRPRLTNSDAMIAQMVVEVGGEDTQVENTHAMLLAVQQKVRDVPDGKGLGVIYWEPQAARSWSRYKLSCWGEDGKPTTALRAFLPDAGRDALKLQSR